MQIDLERVREEPLSWRESKSIEAATLDREQLSALSDVEWSGRVVFADPGFFLKGSLRYDQTLVCMRCLETRTEPVDAEVELLLLVEPRDAERADEEAEEEHELEEEELGVLVLSEEMVDTDPILFEQLQLNVPMKPLCRSDCQGLCPVCGADQNREECSCETETTDPRWAALAKLKERLES